MTRLRLTALAAALAGTALTGGCVAIDASDMHVDNDHGRAPVGAMTEATLRSASGAVVGKATFNQGTTGLLIRIDAQNMTLGWHGIHLHAVGSCEPSAFTSAGAHVNHGDPKASHGLLNADGPDDGDLPNIWAGSDGRVHAELFTTRGRLSSEGPGQYLLDADGSALVVHANTDDHTTQPIGGAGDRVACGVLATG